jgi:hypothetical protein
MLVVQYSLWLLSGMRITEETGSLIVLPIYGNSMLALPISTILDAKLERLNGLVLIYTHQIGVEKLIGAGTRVTMGCCGKVDCVDKAK